MPHLLAALLRFTIACSFWLKFDLRRIRWFRARLGLLIFSIGLFSVCPLNVTGRLGCDLRWRHPDMVALKGAGLAWQVIGFSESSCTKSGRGWQVFRVSGARCRRFATGARETCRESGETAARRFGKSGNLPREAQNAARRPGNSENLPAWASAATRTRKTRQHKLGQL